MTLIPRSSSSILSAVEMHSKARPWWFRTRSPRSGFPLPSRGCRFAPTGSSAVRGSGRTAAAVRLQSQQRSERSRDSAASSGFDTDNSTPSLPVPAPLPAGTAFSGAAALLVRFLPLLPQRPIHGHITAQRSGSVQRATAAQVASLCLLTGDKTSRYRHLLDRRVTAPTAAPRTQNGGVFR